MSHNKLFSAIRSNGIISRENFRASPGGPGAEARDVLASNRGLEDIVIQP